MHLSGNYPIKHAYNLRMEKIPLADKFGGFIKNKNILMNVISVPSLIVNKQFCCNDHPIMVEFNSLSIFTKSLHFHSIKLPNPDLICFTYKIFIYVERIFHLGSKSVYRS